VGEVVPDVDIPVDEVANGDQDQRHGAEDGQYSEYPTR
jgi:hypothetical protein